MPTSSTLFGVQTYRWGIDDPNALTLIDGVAVESLEYQQEPEVNAAAMNAEGVTVAKVVSKQVNYKFTAKVSGYINDETAFDAVTNFTFQSRFYIITNKSKTFNNTDFAKCAVDAESFAAITS